MLAKEAKVCMYELLRASVEVRYGGTGWPADPKAWALLEKECGAIAQADETEGSTEVIAYRYGNTYAVLRNGDQYPGHVIPLKDLVGLTSTQPVLHLANRWANGFFNLVNQHLARGNYTEEIKAEFTAAFEDFAIFDLGAGDGASVIARLERDEQGRKAVADVRTYLEEVKGILKAIASQPFGIERDFVHLRDSARYGLSSALMHGMEDWILFVPSNTERQNLQRDTLGVEAFSIWDVSGNDPTPKDDLTARLEKWVALYLGRVEFIAHRWREESSSEVDSRLSGLAEQVRAWKGAAHLLDKAQAYVKTGVESAQRKVVQGVTQMVTDAQDSVNSLAVPAFTWKGHPHELYELISELVGKKWLEVPKNRGKVSRDELARRVHRAFDFSSGEVLKQSTAQSYLKETGPRPAQGVPFALPKNPRAEPA